MLNSPDAIGAASRTPKQGIAAAKSGFADTFGLGHKWPFPQEYQQIQGQNVYHLPYSMRTTRLD